MRIRTLTAAIVAASLMVPAVAEARTSASSMTYGSHTTANVDSDNHARSAATLAAAAALAMSVGVYLAFKKNHDRTSGASIS